VALWSTHNEPYVVAFPGYAHGSLAPGLANTGQAYQAAHHLLLSHARAVQIFRERNYPGKIGIVLNVEHSIPASDRPADLDARQRLFEHVIGLFADPIFLGHYPEKLLEWIGPMAPQVQPGDLELIHQPVDFVGINYYMSKEVAHDHNGGYLRLRDVQRSLPMWGRTEMGWGIYPAGLTAILQTFKNRYGNPPIYVTENGCAALDEPDGGGYVEDWERINYLRAHLIAAHDALQAGVDLRGYYVWSLFDNFEWAQGYRPRFGIVRVDFDSLKRIPKKSYEWYKEVIANNGVVE
jgi:beta-glucosidase